MGHERVSPEAVDLIPLEFGPLQGGGDEDGAPALVHLAGMRHAFFGIEAEDGAQHADDVFVGMVVVVKQDDVVERREPGFGLVVGGLFGLGQYGRHSQRQ